MDQNPTEPPRPTPVLPSRAPTFHLIERKPPRPGAILLAIPRNPLRSFLIRLYPR